MKPEKIAGHLLKKRKKELALAAIALLVAAVAGLYFSGGEPGSPEESVVVKAIDTIAGSLNPAKTNAPKNEFVAEYDFDISEQAMGFLEETAKASVEAGYRLDFETHNTDAELKQGEKSCSVKIGLAGNGPSHYNGKKKSFRVEADCLAGGKKSLDFFLPLERDYFGLLYSQYLAGRLGLPSPEHEIALVKFNGVPQGLYAVEESWGKGFLERIQEPNLSIVRRSENWIQDHPEAGGGEMDYSAGMVNPTRHFSPFDLEISNFAGIDSEFESEIMYKARQMLDAIESGDQSQFENIFDLEQVAKIEAYIAIRGERHDFIGDNTRFFYDTTSGKFGLVPRSEGGLESLALPGYGGIERQISTSRDQPELTSRYILRNPELRNRRNEIIWQLLQEKDELVSKYEELEQKYMPVFLADSTDSVRSSKTAYYVRINKEHLKQNIELLEKQFSYGKAYINIIQKQNTITIEIIPDSTTALKTGNFSIKLNPGTNTTAEAIAFDQNGKQKAQETMQITDGTIELSGLINQNLLQADLDEEMLPKPAKFTYELAFQGNADINSVQVEMQNAITGKALPQNDIYAKIAKGIDDYSELQSQAKQEFLDSHPELSFKEEDGVLHLVEGDYEIKENTIIPKGLDVVIDAGAKIRIGPGKSIVSYSDLGIEGTEEKPVVVSRLDENQAFGVLGIIGEAGSKTTIRHLQLSGGNAHFINGIFFSGQLSVYHSDLDIFGSKLSGSSSDDGMSVKYAKVLIDNSEFSGNARDQLDLDFCNGVVRNSRFDATQKENPDGDGLDLSGGSILVSESLFAGNGDKGISIGEECPVVFVYNSRIAGNNIGSAVKDNSRAFFVKSTFGGNKTAIEAYEKKPLFGGAKFYIYDNIFEGNNDNISLDEKSDYKNVSFVDSELALIEGMAANGGVEGLAELVAEKE